MKKSEKTIIDLEVFDSKRYRDIFRMFFDGVEIMAAATLVMEMIRGFTINKTIPSRVPGELYTDRDLFVRILGKLISGVSEECRNEYIKTAEENLPGVEMNVKLYAEGDCMIVHNGSETVN